MKHVTLPYKKLCIALSVCVVSGLLVLGYANMRILAYTPGILSLADHSPTEYALVFGGGMNVDGSQSIMQMDRVSTGVALYASGTVAHVIMTGDDGGNRSNEVDAMKEQAEVEGIPAANVSTDPHGYRTYESCWRAKHVYGIDTAIVISQDFHLPRIIYICSRMGIDVVGASGNLREYGSVWAPGPREILARLKAVWQVEVSKPTARIVE